MEKVRPELSSIDDRRARVRFEEDVPVRKRVVGLTRKFHEENKRKRLVQSLSYRPPSILKNSTSRKTMVLHGRVVYEPDGRGEGLDEGKMNRTASTSGSVRQKLERKSTFYKLSEELQNLQESVSRLERFVRGNTEREASWRIRNLIQQARNQDKKLYHGIYNYERTLLNNTDDTRKAQTACMKLHLDYKKAHRSFLMCLSNLREHATEEDADFSLGSVGWTGLTPDGNKEEEVAKQPEPDPQPTPEIIVTKKLRPSNNIRLVHELGELVKPSKEDNLEFVAADVDDLEFVAADVDDSVMSPVSESTYICDKPRMLCGCLEKQEPTVVHFTSQDDSVCSSTSWMSKLEQNVYSMQVGMQRFTDRLGCGVVEPRRRRVPRMAAF